MTPFDAAMAGVVVAGMVWGTWRGITWQLASLASLVLGYSVSHPLSGQLAPQFPGPPVVARALAMLAIYVAISGSIFLGAWAIRATLRRLRFEAFDRHLGMILGGLEGALLGLVGTLFVISLLPQTRGPIFASPTGRLVCQVMDTLGPILPSEVRDELAPFWTSAGTFAAEESGTTAPPPRDRVAPGLTDPNVSKARGLLEEGKSRLGHAIIESAETELERRGSLYGREVERR